MNKVAIALIKDSLGRYLLIQQKGSDFGDMTDAWYPPAGHVEVGETVEEALVRELQEELSLVIKPIREISVWPQDIPGEEGHWWECEIVSGEIKMDDSEIADCRYYTIDEIKTIKKWPAETKFFERFLYPNSQ